LAIVARDGGTEVLSWETGRKAWRLHGVYASRANRAGIRVVILPTDSDLWDPTFATRDVWLPSSWRNPPLEELPALVDYLTDTPAARSGLATRGYLEQLLVALADKDWRRPHPPNEPLLGDRLDVYVAINRALAQAHWRRFGLRPVRGEWTPQAQDIAQRARGLLLRGVSERVRDEELVTQVDRFLNTGRWPFDVLLGTSA
jgi:hypothetical protein